MEKVEKATKRRAPAADAEGLRLTKKARESDDDELVEEFFATIRRMRGAVKYFERSRGGESGKRGLSSWRIVLETGAELPAVDPSLKAAPEKEPRRERAGVLPDLNASPEGSSGGD
ncbi:hypothetical protein SAY87_003089 [Trapa incisa]|uniref:Uncharacterized protein n=1 Tax=Trapa incisa TaxID=236973 RepID=A0AAN7KNJ8_9MYRT|nr:hypothetical protein SAY87_003089 [Trapa incisa]